MKSKKQKRVRRKVRKNIFEALFEKRICFAVCISSNSFAGGETQVCSAEYAVIINSCDAALIEKYPFCKAEGYEQILLRKLSDNEIQFFQTNQEKFVKVKHNEYGRVYELKGNSFKAAFDRQPEAG